MQSPPKSPFGYILYLTRLFPGWAIAALLAVMSATTIDGINNFLLKNLINALTQDQATGTADPWLWTYLYVGGFILSWACWRTSGFMGMKWITGIRARSYETLFGYLTYHSAEYFSNRFAGALANKIGNASDSGSRIIQTSLWQILPMIMSFAVGMVVLSTANMLLTLIMSVWVVVFLIIMTFLANKRRPLARAAAESGSTMKGVMVDSASNMTAVHQSGHHEYEIEHLQDYIIDSRDAGRRIWFYSEVSLVIGNSLMAVYMLTMIGTAVYLKEAGLVTVGDIAMIVSLMMGQMRQLLFIGNEINKLMDDYGQTAEGLGEIFIPHDIVDEKDAKDLKTSKGSIDFKDVSFAYGKVIVFDGFELAVPGGQKVGLVGHSGAGKTSLTSLLLRQYDVKDGGILIDGQDIRKATQVSIRRQIAIVPQDTSLFHRSIRENIRYGNLDATDADVERAAKLAQAHDFIMALPKQYDTLVGERGIKLSGGQRQRVAIARAILKNAPILVLDEATSALDSESEACIQQALQELMKGKTVLAIAHRLSTLRMMDRIIVLDKGKIAEDGTHDELLEKKGIYARLWESQVKGFIQE